MDLLEMYKKEIGIDNIPSFLYHMTDTPCLVRLKNIDYFCGMKYASPHLDVYKFKENPTRFDHSLTTALLTWKLTMNKEQTIAALYHDVATPCFSHVIDYMNEDYVEQESTEKFTKKIINRDEILNKLFNYYHINKKDIINYKKYPVVDNKRPKLCADRLDGIITTGVCWTKSLNEEDIKKIVNDIALFYNEDNELEIGFNSEEVANLVYDTSVKINEYTHKNDDIYMMQLLAKITKLLIEKKIITYEKLYMIYEVQLINIIKNCNDQEILCLYDIFKNIKNNEIPQQERFDIKEMTLNPLVKTKRLIK